MKFTGTALALLASTTIGTAFADEGLVPKGIPPLEHVFVIIMENHGYDQIIGNPSAPFVNAEASSANLAWNFYAVAHPSLTNYLEITGGSNFGVLDDNDPDWHNAGCATNLASVPNTEASTNPICPIAGTGKDAATPVIDYTNETSGPPGTVNIDGSHGYPAASTVGKTIVDQLTTAGMSWKSYQENLPPGGADGVNYSDGNWSNLSVFTTGQQALGLTTGNIVKLYAAKHNPFVYFASIQGTAIGGQIPGIVGFDGATGLYADLASGHVPNFSLIAPNQCNDQHGRSNAGPFCNYDPADNGTQNGLNPALIQQGDNAVQKLVTAIKASPVWSKPKTAIVILWDENDYSTAPITNHIVTIVDKNYGTQPMQSFHYYTHFSLLKTVEAAFRLPCLNHACDASTREMGDLFR